jgi:hypothetical protein
MNKSKKLKVKAFACPDSLSEKALKKIGFEITQVVVYKENNCLFLYVDWTAKKDEWKTKYPQLSSTSFGGGCLQSVSLEFNEIPAPYGKDEFGKQYKAHIEIGLDFLNEETYRMYHLSYTSKRKYGYEIIFTPKKFGIKPNSKPIFAWPKENKPFVLDAYLK